MFYTFYKQNQKLAILIDDTLPLLTVGPNPLRLCVQVEPRPNH